MISLRKCINLTGKELTEYTCINHISTKDNESSPPNTKPRTKNSIHIINQPQEEVQVKEDIESSYTVTRRASYELRVTEKISFDTNRRTDNTTSFFDRKDNQNQSDFTYENVKQLYNKYL